MPDLFTYTINDIKAAFPAKDYIRGITYAREGRVRGLKFDSDNEISAFVEGSARNLYKVNVQIRNDKGRFPGSCSCPLGYKCKHIVATLVEGIKSLKPSKIISTEPGSKKPAQLHQAKEVQETPLDNEVNAWLNNFDSAPDPIIHNYGKLLIYLLEQSKGEEAFLVSLVTTSMLKSGVLSNTRKTYRREQLEALARSQHVKEQDVVIIRLILAFTPYSAWYDDSFKVPSGEEGLILLKLLLASKRCYLPKEIMPANYLSLGKPRKAVIGWKVEADGMQTTHIILQDIKEPIILKLVKPYYLDPDRRTVGRLDTGLSDSQTLAWLKAPKVKPEQAEAVNKRLVSLAKDITPELLPVALPMSKLDITPVPCLKFTSVTAQSMRIGSWSLRPAEKPVSIAAVALSFNYDGISFDSNDVKSQATLYHNGEVHVITRNRIFEKTVTDTLDNLGLSKRLSGFRDAYRISPEHHSYLTFVSFKADPLKDKTFSHRWEKFMLKDLPILRAKGWQVITDTNFPFNITEPIDGWYVEIDESSGIDWFGLELGVMIEGKRLNLIPVLLKVLKADDNIIANIEQLPDTKSVMIKTEDGRILALPPDRVKLLLTTLRSLFSLHNDNKSKARIQNNEASILAELEEGLGSFNMHWSGGSRLLDLGKRLKGFTAVKDIAPPEIFHGQLRPYQQEGLNWLQFLREFNLAGILADDMGLGKTIQVLAHIATEKAEGRLQQPCLVIAPTSLMANWELETKKFVPDLKVLTLHGLKRKEYFEDIKKHDLVLTTYPLLPRDQKTLLAQPYHLTILDEAQTIKNSNTKITQVVNQLQTSHRLCMTGTPMENHLGELWSLFNFLLPGYLGNQRQFKSIFRNPIEKQKNTQVSELLSRRVKPFILRRTKQEVVTELPLKTEVIRMVELEDEQRDLYEAIRVSMDKKVRREIAARGAERSHIMVLYALLKLRQVCCAPALLKTQEAQKVTKSAKLSELMSMLRTMAAEGRSILLFSQFSSMLALIEEQLNSHVMPYVKLTGRTKDRATPIKQFQEGKVRLFLISLKAGGTGLNLTAADTVIHYDPWWNPAVENQATDRAYRIGQDKPVFVYKLITKGTVEEKIIEMQEKKRQIMDSLFDPTGGIAGKLTANDIQSLFEPLV